MRHVLTDLSPPRRSSALGGALSRLGRRRGVGGGGVTGRDGLGRRIGLGQCRALLGGFGSSVGLYWAQPAGQGARAAERPAMPGGLPGLCQEWRARNKSPKSLHLARIAELEGICCPQPGLFWDDVQSAETCKIGRAGWWGKVGKDERH